MTEPDLTGSRLVALKMIMENFKSYAGVREIGPFHKSFTSIVGPNGSGKSNVIDAIQFVFGKKQNKLRLKKMSELIHNSEKHQNLNKARVSVHFAEIKDHEDRNGYDVVPNSELIITRTVNKQSVSKYFINDNASTFTEVTELLKEKGIDLDNNRFLILQGEVEQISLMKPKAPNEHEDGLLEYIEDIIGTNKYVEKIEQAYKNFEDLTEQRTHKVAVLKGAEREKNSLQEAKEEADDYVQKKTSLIQMRHKSSQVHLHNANQKLKVAKESKAEVQEKLDEEKKKLSEKLLQSKSKEETLAQSRKEHSKALKTYEKSKSEFAALETVFAQLKEQVVGAKSKKKQLAADIDSTTKKVDELVAKSEQLQNDEIEIRKKIEKSGPLLEEAEQLADDMYKKVQSQMEPLRQEKEKKQKEMLPLSKKINKLKQDVELKRSQITLLKEKSQTTRTQYDEAKKSLTTHQEEMETKNKAQSDLEKVKKALESRIPTVQKEYDASCKQEEEFTHQIKSLQSKLHTLDDALKSAKDQDALLTEVIRARDDEEIPGVIDRLGNLGAIDKKYDVAISTACSQLNWIVVKDTPTAKAVIELIKKKNLGTTTCIILDKINTKELCGKMESSFKVPDKKTNRLFDLIKIQQDDVRIAFYHVLRDTLVCDTLDHATKIAYSDKQVKHRVVTLKGELIEESGTMTGGGAKTTSGGMRTNLADRKVNLKTLQSARSEHDEATAQLKQTQSRRDNLSSQLKSLKAQLETSDLNHKKIRMESDACAALVQDLQRTIASLKPLLNQDLDESDQSRMKTYQDELNQLESKLNQQVESNADLDSQIKKLNESIESAGGSEYQAQKALVAQLTRSNQELSSKHNKAQVQLETTLRSIEKSRQIISNHETELQQITVQLESLIASTDQLENDSSPLYMVMNQAKLDAKKQEEIKDALEEEYEIIKKEIEKARNGIALEFQSKLDELIKTEQECDKQVKKRNRLLLELSDQMKEFVTEVGMDSSSLPSLEMLQQQQVEGIDLDALSYDMTMLESSLQSMKPDLSAIARYKSKESDYLQKQSEVDAITKQRDDNRLQYEELRKKRLDEFMKGFVEITIKLKEIYQTITLGGDAELELVDSCDPFSEGIVFSVRPPRKSWKMISNLSGGEKTLSSLALVFALHHFKPTPIYVMDEIDAALDFKNVSIVGNFIKQKTTNAQFIVISLRNNMFELADMLVGIYKTDHCTKSVTIDPNKLCA
ncbi:structural maintenance of chromosome protein [Acrasis kona]|uniref:Structural maintenance of chromosomes protein n=1 Tax=Acrasis kona TaxID=1008807 RepID=A0AAW2ZC30_9EUKA